MSEGKKLCVFYDGSCSFCVNAVEAARERDRGRQVEFIPYQTPDFPTRFPGIEPQEQACSVQVRLSDGTVMRRELAVAALLEVLPGKDWMARLIRFPLVRPFAAIGYRLVAANRKWISRWF